jgi:hypothetical protein
MIAIPFDESVYVLGVAITDNRGDVPQQSLKDIDVEDARACLPCVEKVVDLPDDSV